MKRLIVLFAGLPSAALAHGGHPPVTAEAHTAIHVSPLLALTCLALVILAGLVWRARS